jgi:MGT family glycosyltransferase
MCIEALSGLRWHVVLAIGDNNDPASFRPLPPHFEVIQHIPQIQVLPYTDLLICLGGMATSVEAMYHGIPLLMMTHGHAEPELYADNMVRLGLGKHLKRAETNTENVRNSVLQLSTDGALLHRVKDMQHVVQRDPGGEETVNRMEEYLANR